jgi:hypothetical protein
MLDSPTFQGEEPMATLPSFHSVEEEDPILAEVRRARREVDELYGDDDKFRGECYRRLTYLIGLDVYAWTKAEGLKLVHKGPGLLELDELKALFDEVRATVRREMRGG